MAMINDKGPEESRDTDATYIILSHQSVHLPGPTRQKRMGLGEKEEVEVKETKKKKKGGKKKGAGYLLLVFCTHKDCFFFSFEKNKKQVTKK